MEESKNEKRKKTIGFIVGTIILLVLAMVYFNMLKYDR